MEKSKIYLMITMNLRDRKKGYDARHHDALRLLAWFHLKWIKVVSYLVLLKSFFWLLFHIPRGRFFSFQEVIRLLVALSALAVLKQEEKKWRGENTKKNVSQVETWRYYWSYCFNRWPLVTITVGIVVVYPKFF